MSALPPGARCGRHPEVEASALCARCGDFFCARCAVQVDGAVETPSYCARCEPLAREPFLFERRAEIGLARAFWRTALGTLTRTRETFAPGFRDRSVLPALAYAIAIDVPVTLAEKAAELAWPSEDRLALMHGPFGWAFSDRALFVEAVAAPIILVLGLLLSTGLWWVGFRIVGRATRPFSHFVRTVAYVNGSTAPLGLVALLPDSVDFPLMIALLLFTLVLEGRALGAVMQAPGRSVLGVGVIVALMTLALLGLLGVLFAAFVLSPVP